MGVPGSRGRFGAELRGRRKLAKPAAQRLADWPGRRNCRGLTGRTNAFLNLRDAESRDRQEASRSFHSLLHTTSGTIIWEPPGADPHAWWCGRGRTGMSSPIPIPFTINHRPADAAELDVASYGVATLVRRKRPSKTHFVALVGDCSWQRRLHESGATCERGSGRKPRRDSMGVPG